MICRRLLLAVALLAAVDAGCATAGGAGANAVLLRVEGNVKEASVLVDDHLIGHVSDLSSSGRRIPPGFHRIEIRHPGYYSIYREVDLKPGDEVLVKAHLHELVQ